MNISNKKSITLVEMLISISIFSIIISCLYSSFNVGLYAYRRIEQNIQLSQTASLIFNQISLDLKNSIPFSEKNTKFSGTDNEIKFYTIIDVYDNGNWRKHYSFVSYYIEKNSLIRVCKIDKESINENLKADVYEIATDINLFEIQYKKVNTNKTFISLYEWVETSNLPVAIYIVLNLDGKKFEKLIALPLAKYFSNS